MYVDTKYMVMKLWVQTFLQIVHLTSFKTPII